MLGSDPFYFHFIFICFILKGAPAPSFYLGTPDGVPQPIFPKAEPGDCTNDCTAVNHGTFLPGVIKQHSDFKSKHELVGGFSFNHLEKYESQWEGLSHILWKIKHV